MNQAFGLWRRAVFLVREGFSLTLSNDITNTETKQRVWTQLFWLVAGLALAIAVLAFTEPPKARRVPFSIGLTAWFVDTLLVALLSAHPLGARVAVLAAGLFMALPPFVVAAPLNRGLLACILALPLIGAAELISAPRQLGFAARLLFPLTYLSRGQVQRRAPGLEFAALGRLAAATVLLAASFLMAKVAFSFQHWLPMRWLAGVMTMAALAELLTAALPLFAAALGLRVPPLFHSPYRAVTLGEFWAQRWNVAASALFHQYCFAPIARRNVSVALFVAFAVSALGHAFLADITLGAWAAVLWTVFFMAQPLLICLERVLKVRQWPAVAGRAWTLGMLAVTAPLFVEPMLQLAESVWGPPEMVVLPTAIVLGTVMGFCALVSLAAYTVAGRAAPTVS